MDPNETLAQLRTALDALRTTGDDENVGDAVAAAFDAAEAAANLDEWLSRGGFLPTAWQRVHG
jgi:hypothetical protein